VYGDDVTELGREEASVPFFRRKEHCSRCLKGGGAWEWLLLTQGLLYMQPMTAAKTTTTTINTTTNQY